MNYKLNDKQWAHKQAIRMVNDRAGQTDALWVESEEEAAAELAFLLDQVDAPTYEEEISSLVTGLEEYSPEEEAEFDAWDRAQASSYYEASSGPHPEELWSDTQ